MRTLNVRARLRRSFAAFRRRSELHRRDDVGDPPQREAIRLLVAVAPALNEADALRRQNSVLTGPDRGMFRVDADAEQVDRAIDRVIWLGLIRLRDAGARLSDAASARLAGFERQYPQWQPAEGDRDDFAFWMGDGGGWGEFKRTAVGLRELIDLATARDAAGECARSIFERHQSCDRVVDTGPSQDIHRS